MTAYDTEQWNDFIQGLSMFTDDFMPNGREPQGVQMREEIFNDTQVDV